VLRGHPTHSKRWSMSSCDCSSFSSCPFLRHSDQGAEYSHTGHSLPKPTGIQIAPVLEVPTQRPRFQTGCSAAVALEDATSDLVWWVGLRCPRCWPGCDSGTESVCRCPTAVMLHDARGQHVAGTCCPQGVTCRAMCSWPEHLHSQKVSQGQAWRSPSFSCSLCWILPEYMDTMLRFASALDSPADQGMGGPPQPSLDQLGHNLGTQVQQQSSLPTAASSHHVP